ncbi:hypothetical protein SBRY_160007 [Actinacidiphila bryophytorum]|uniref:Uncharacterized protein n=1 Tax=Actinacidiphila bryophytorum TaxID=1436133 RepID=A0A9W4ED58_9ACTN|nr:hypothetical protein SBRY_160007 [Actinacidiphila bryophytorum]
MARVTVTACERGPGGAPRGQGLGDDCDATTTVLACRAAPRGPADRLLAVAGLRVHRRVPVGARHAGRGDHRRPAADRDAHGGRQTPAGPAARLLALRRGRGAAGRSRGLRRHEVLGTRRGGPPDAGRRPGGAVARRCGRHGLRRTQAAAQGLLRGERQGPAALRQRTLGGLPAGQEADRLTRAPRSLLGRPRGRLLRDRTEGLNCPLIGRISGRTTMVPEAAVASVRDGAGRRSHP